jgi:hypothetical protein
MPGQDEVRVQDVIQGHNELAQAAATIHGGASFMKLDLDKPSVQDRIRSTLVRDRPGPAGIGPPDWNRRARRMAPSPLGHATTTGTTQGRMMSWPPTGAVSSPTGAGTGLRSSTPTGRHSSTARLQVAEDALKVIGVVAAVVALV